MAELDGQQMFGALRAMSSNIGRSLSEPGAKTAATKMYSLSQLTYEEKRLIQNGQNLVDCVLQKETLPPNALLELMKAFVAGLRDAEVDAWADEIERNGQRGVTIIKEGAKTALLDAAKETGSKNSDAVDAAPAPTRRRNPYPLGKGRAIIICISKFNSTPASGYVSGRPVGENDIPGNEVDRKSLEEFFRNKCGFFVETIYNEDATCSNITDRLKAVASDTEAEYAMFVCAVLSHGGINGENKCYVKDYHLNDLPVEDITSPFKESIVLAEKPKVFIFNACRGVKFEGYYTLSAGAGFQPEATKRVHIPREAHFLHFYSSVEGYYSLTGSGGSDFVTKLVSTLAEENGLDVVAAFTDVVAQMTEIGPVPVLKGKDKTGKVLKENEVVPTPCIVSTLTKALFFR